MNTYSIDEIIEMAIRTETLGYQFYTTIAEKFKKDEGLAKLLLHWLPRKRFMRRYLPS